MDTFLILDTNYLCHRAYHTTGDLMYGGEGTGVIYGVLKSVESLMERFQTKNVIWTFDYGCVGRKEILPEYKANREKKDLSEEEMESIKGFRKQVKQLERSILPKLGYRNVFSQRGFEADDVIASLANALISDEIIIISSDKDLWQLIDGNVSCYNPQTQKFTNLASFRKEWGVEPTLWPHCKALAGDASDNIQGVRGVGLMTAAKYYRSELKDTSVAFKRIVGEGIEIHNRNIKLIKLPFPGTEKFALRKDKCTEEKRLKIYAKLGFSEKKIKGVKNKSKASRIKGFFDK